MIKNPSFLGTGWNFPPQFNRGGDRPISGVKMAIAEEDIRQSLEIILTTQPGERLMHPDFGCELSQFVFEEVRQGVMTRIKDIVSDALLNHEPRIQVDAVEVNESSAKAGLLLIEIDYTIRQTNTRSNLVFPFYLNEATIV
jgi:phage baseplate assembly protein W